jgi:hypothetical protein
MKSARDSGRMASDGRPGGRGASRLTITRGQHRVGMGQHGVPGRRVGGLGDKAAGAERDFS